MLDTSPLDAFIASIPSKVSRRATGATFQEMLANTIATSAVDTRDSINLKSFGEDKDVLQNALIDIWSAIYGVFDNGLAATAVKNLKKLETKPDITTKQRGAKIALFLRLYCSEKHVGALLGVLVAKGALTEVTLVAALKELEQIPLPADFHTQSRTAQKRILLQFIHPLLMTCIAASVGTNPLQLPQRYLDTVTSRVEATCKEEPLPSDAGNGAGAGEPLAATVVDRSALPASKPPEVTLAWEELRNADDVEKLEDALHVLKTSLERFSQDTSNVKNAIDCLMRSSVTTPISVSIGSSPFYRLSLLMAAWSQPGTTETVNAINEKLTFFIKDKEGDIKLKQQICDFVQSEEFSLFHLAKLLGRCQASGTLDQSQITNAVKYIAHGGDLKALAFALVNSLSTKLGRHPTPYSTGLTFAQYSENVHKKGETPMSAADYASL